MQTHSDWTRRSARLERDFAAAIAAGEPYDPETCAALLHVLSRPATLIDPRQAEAAASKAAKWVAIASQPDHPWRLGLDGLQDQARLYAVLRTPPCLAELVATLQALAAQQTDSPVRVAQATQSIARTLANATSHSTLAATTERAADIPLGAAMPAIVGAHAVPLVTLPLSQMSIARQLALNLLGWQAQVKQRRLTWVAARAEAEYRIRAAVVEDCDEILHLREEVRELAAVVEQLGRHEPVEIPQVLAFDRGMSDVAHLVTELALSRWLLAPAVAVPLLSFVAGSRTSRPFVPELVRAALERTDLSDEVVRSVVALGAAKLTGLTREETWLGTEGINRIARDDPSARGLDDVETLIAADSHLRESLWRFAMHRQADAGSRVQAAQAVLASLPSNRVTRIAEALRLDEVAQSAVLRWVASAKEHAAYEVLASWEPPAALRPAWYLALASTGDIRAMELLTPELSRGDHEAEQAALAVGMRLATAQVRLRREIASRKEPLEDAFDCIHAERSRELEASASATLAGAEVAAQRCLATAQRLQCESRMVEAQVEAAAYVVRLNTILVLAEQLTRRLEDERQRLAVAANALLECQHKLSGVHSAALSCESAIQRENERMRRINMDLAAARDRVGRAQYTVTNTDQRVAQAMSNAQMAQSAFSRATAPEEVARARNDLSRTRALLDEARAALEAGRRELLTAGSEINTLEQETKSATRRLSDLETERHRIHQTLQRFQSEASQARARANQCQRTAAATDRELCEATRQAATVGEEQRRTAAVRARVLQTEQWALKQTFSAIRETQSREIAAQRVMQSANQARKAAQQRVQELDQLDRVAFAKHESDIAPAAAELANIDRNHRVQSEESERRARAVQALTVSADVLYCYVRKLDGLHQFIRPYSRQLARKRVTP